MWVAHVGDALLRNKGVRGCATILTRVCKVAYTGSNKRVLKNTIVLYVRMMVVMFVSLFTSRLLLKYLGVEDYGLYNVVGAVVGMMSMINGVLASSGTRYLTCSLGADGAQKLKETFTTMINVQLLVALLSAIVLLALGAWVLNGKANIPPERVNAVNFVFYCAVFTAVLHLLVVPFHSAVIAYERMSAFAWLTFLDVFAKLGVVYMLSVTPFDCLKTYALLGAIVQVIYSLITVGYVVVQFKELRYIRYFNLKYLLEIYAFAGWNFLRNCTALLLTQAVTVLNQRYFGAVLVAAFSIAVTVWGQIKAFINNYRTAANPQIIKLFSAGKFLESRQLMVNTVLLSLFIYLVLAVTLFVYADRILAVWLEEVPVRAVEFVRIVLVIGLAAVFDDCFYTAISAKGKMAGYTLMVCVTDIAVFIATWGLIWWIRNPYTAAFMLLIRTCIGGFLIVPAVLKKVVGYEAGDFLQTYIPSIKVCSVTVSVGALFWLITPHGIFAMFVGGALCAFSVAAVCWTLGVPMEIKDKLLMMVRSKFGLILMAQRRRG